MESGKFWTITKTWKIFIQGKAQIRINLRVSKGRALNPFTFKQSTVDTN